MPTKQQRLSFGVACLKLARKELKDHGREFVDSDQDLFDLAVQYGASIKLTREEAIEASKMKVKMK
jgi:hypothetical protein